MLIEQSDECDMEHLDETDVIITYNLSKGTLQIDAESVCLLKISDINTIYVHDDTSREDDE